MRLAIHDYSQEVAVKMEDTVKDKRKGKEREKKIAIDAVDLLILDWFAKFYPFMQKRVIDGKEYAWIKRSKVIDDLPILRISEQAVSDRLRKLVHFKLLEYKLVQDGGTFCYYTFGNSYSQLVYDFSTIEKGGGVVNYTKGSGSTTHTPCSQLHNKDRGLDSSSKNILRDESKIKNSRCECGGLIAKNTQTGIYECISCFKRYPISQKDVEMIAMFDRMKER